MHSPKSMFKQALLLLILATISSLAAAGEAPPSPFQDKLEPVHGVHVDDAKQWNGATARILKSPDDTDDTVVTRLGSVLIAPGVTVDVVTRDNQVNFPYFFELVQAGTKTARPRVLLSYAVMLLGGTEWYFPGNGFVYVRSQQWKLCGPWTTRKFRWTGTGLDEVPQPLLWVGATAKVEATTPLYDTADGHHVVATVLKGSEVQFIGMQPIGSWDAAGPHALLVKTQLGLLGWHRFFGGTAEQDGQLDIYMCN